MTDTNPTPTANVGASYGLKLPDPNVPFASQEFTAWLTIPVEVDASADDAVTLEDLRAVAAALAIEVKTQVMAQLGVSPKDLVDGVIAPDLTDYKGAEKPKASGGGSKYAKRSSGGGRPPAAGRQTRPSGGGQRSATVRLAGNIGWNGDDVEGEYYDNRGKKRSGDWSANAADFAPVDKQAGLPSLWMHKDGVPNDNVLEALEAAGIDYDWEEFVG